MKKQFSLLSSSSVTNNSYITNPPVLPLSNTKVKNTLKSTNKPVYTVCIDKLDLLLNGTIIQINNIPRSDENEYKISNELILCKTTKNTHPSFYSCYEVFLHSRPFAFIYYNYNGKYRYSCEKPILLHIQNHNFYADGLVRKLNLLFQSLNCVDFVKYDKIDIAIDGYDFVSEHSKYSMSKKFKRQQLVAYSSLLIDDKTKEILSFKVGSDKSDKYLTIYQKQQEITNSNKSYIRGFWKKNGLKEYKRRSIDRIEGRFNAKALKNFKNEFSVLEDPKELMSFFQSEFEGRLLFKTKRSKKQISLIDWSVFKLIKISKHKNTKKPSDGIRISKSMIHKLFIDYTKSQKQYLHQTMLELIEDNNLIDWSKKNFSKWLKESHRLN